MNKIKFILLLLAYCSSQSIYSQDYISYEKESIIGFYDTTSYVITEPHNSLIIEQKGNDKVVLEFSFDKYNKCDGIIKKYYQLKDTDHSIEAALFYDENKWIEVDEDTYIAKSRISWIVSWSKDRESECKKLEIVRTPNEEVKLVITYSIVVMKTKEWKKLKKKKQLQTTL